MLETMAAEGTGNRLSQLVDIARLLVFEPEPSRVVERILLTAKLATRADGGSLYMVEDGGRSLAFGLMLNDTLGIRRGGSLGAPIDLQPPPLFEADGTPNRRSVVAHCVHARRSVRLDDAYAAEGFDFAGARAFDQAHGYRSRSFLTVPMVDHVGRVIGVLQLVNARAPDGTASAFSADDQAFVEALAALAAIAFEKGRLADRL
ncbi:MAG TPA: GAF domain-containing protein [Casimicrobiaceae bacterium]